MPPESAHTIYVRTRWDIYFQIAGQRKLLLAKDDKIAELEADYRTRLEEVRDMHHADGPPTIPQFLHSVYPNRLIESAGLADDLDAPLQQSRRAPASAAPAA